MIWETACSSHPDQSEQGIWMKILVLRGKVGVERVDSLLVDGWFGLNKSLILEGVMCCPAHFFFKVRWPLGDNYVCMQCQCKTIHTWFTG